MLRYIKKISQIGVRRVFQVAYARYKQARFCKKFRSRAYTHNAKHTWDDITKRYAIIHDVHAFHKMISAENKHELHELDAYIWADTTQIIASADKICAGKFTAFDNTVFNPITSWHEDATVLGEDRFFDTSSFYTDISLPRNNNTTTLIKDIKFPWEIARFHYAVILGQAYVITNDQSYAHTFVELVSQWLQASPYLCGIHWMCPMECAIRSINLLWAWYYFKNEPSITIEFWEKLYCSFFDHLVYLEHNWELYDGRTNNHYLSNLAGYLYLNYFFNDDAAVKRIKKTLLKEVKRVVLSDGTLYEGSTAYHELVAELLIHAYFFLDHTPELKYILVKMLLFMERCRLNAQDKILIGDCDSSKLLYCGITQKLNLHFFSIKGEKKNINIFEIVHYTQFGLSVITSSYFHLTLRHHAYRMHQVPGHFHYDAGSITLAVQGVPVLVDPGSYVYTGSSAWRNYFRSIAQHNTFSITNYEPYVFKNIFSLTMPENKPKDKNAIVEENNDDYYSIQTSHTLYRAKNLRAYRKIIIEKKTHIISLFDWWEPMYKTDELVNINTQWNFLFYPAISLYKNGSYYAINHNNNTLALLSSDLLFLVKDGWYASAYGKKMPCVQLTAAMYSAPFCVIRSSFYLIK